MLSIGTVASAAAAGAYFNKDDYYARSDDSPSAWLGRGADALGLAGPVEKATFTQLLEGRVPERDQQLGREIDGVWKHQPGWDLTFKAPKSVSIMAEVMGDERLIAAHDRAVAAAIGYVEERYASTRLLNGKAVEPVATGNLVVASFRHDLSRNTDPLLHTHAVVVNMTESERGWRSLQSRPFFDHSKEIGVVYQQALALEARALGYEIEQGKHGTFELRGVEDRTLAAFSTRRAEIEAALRGMGIDPEKASPDVVAKVVLSTRQKKVEIDRDVVREIWTATLSTLERSSLTALRDGAIERTQSGDLAVQSSEKDAQADRVLGLAVAVLSERDAAFSRERLVDKASEYAVGFTTRAAVEGALDRTIERGDLTAKRVIEADRREKVDLAKEGVTTEEARRDERAVIAAMRDGRGRVDAIATPRQAARTLNAAIRESAAQGFAWTDDQRAATLGLLRSRDRVHGVQGYAGTAKTTTVLATYADRARQELKDVRALAPTASAAGTLGVAIGVRGETVDKHLARLRAFDAERGGRQGPEQVWVVDEASMLSTSKTLDLMRAAEKAGARLVLVGDVRQLGSVEEGAAFRQLQNAGMTTERLETIVRQTEAGMTQAVTLAAAGEAAEALRHFEATGGRVIEAGDAGQRTAAMAAAWLALSAAERDRTIVIDPSREGRDQANAAIRAGLIAEGTLGRTGVEGDTLSASAMTKAERKQAQNYRAGMVVRFGRELQLKDVSEGAKRGSVAAIEKGGYAVVEAVDRETGVVRLAVAEGRRLAWKPAQKGARDAAVYTTQSQELRANDRIIWTRNDAERGLTNGDRGRVEAVDRTAKTATVAFGSGDGKRVTLSLDRLADQHWRHGYVETAHAAQGRTADRVIAHAEAWRINLVNQASVYVALSRARREGIVITDSREALLEAVAGRAGLKETALSERAVQARAAVLDDRPTAAQPDQTADPRAPERTTSEPAAARSGSEPRTDDQRQGDGRERREREAAEQRRAREIERRIKRGARPRQRDRQPSLPGLDPAQTPRTEARTGRETPSAPTRQQPPAQTASMSSSTPAAAKQGTPPGRDRATADPRPAPRPTRAEGERAMGRTSTAEPGRASPAKTMSRGDQRQDRDRTAERDAARPPQRTDQAPDRRAREEAAAKREKERSAKEWRPGMPIRNAEDLDRMAAYDAREERERQMKGLDRDNGPSFDR